jgi:hypothetical protein
LALSDSFGGVSGVLLLRFVFELLLLALVIGASNNLIVDPRDNFLNDGVGGKNRGR